MHQLRLQATLFCKLEGIESPGRLGSCPCDSRGVDGKPSLLCWVGPDRLPYDDESGA